jgi:hypothetical protein
LSAPTWNSLAVRSLVVAYSHLRVRLLGCHRQYPPSKPGLVWKAGVYRSVLKLHADLRAPTLTPNSFAIATVRLMITGSPACPPHAMFAASIIGMSSLSGPPSHIPNDSPQSTLISTRRRLPLGWVRPLVATMVDNGPRRSCRRSPACILAMPAVVKVHRVYQRLVLGLDMPSVRASDNLDRY